MAYYIVYQAGETIFGIGENESEAWKDAYRSANQDGDYDSLESLQDDEDFDVSECSLRLYEEAKSGCVTGWRFGPGEIAVTKEETAA